MQKRDFIQAALIEWLPQLAWEPDQALRYAERAWAVLNERGYGDVKPTGSRDIPKAYDKLAPDQRAAFDIFWVAFGKHGNRDRAAARWTQLGQLPKPEYDSIVEAAKRESDARKKLPENRTGIHADGWLNQRRWLDNDETGVETAQKQQNRVQQEIRRVAGDLNHAKQMAQQTGEKYWQDQVGRLTEQLKQLRDANA